MNHGLKYGIQIQSYRNVYLKHQFHDLVIDPVLTTIPEDKIKDCKDDDLKRNGFYISKAVSWIHVMRNELQVNGVVKVRKTIQNVKFFATKEEQTPPSIGILDAIRGECRNIDIKSDHRQCGVATELLKLCLRDDPITDFGGLIQFDGLQKYPNFRNPDKFPGYSIWKDTKKYKEKVLGNCETLIAMPCFPDGAEPDGSAEQKDFCRTYLEAAQYAGYNHIFLDNDANSPKLKHSIWGIKDALKEFQKNPQKFLKNYGRNWFFCKCMAGKERKCKKMECKTKAACMKYNLRLTDFLPENPHYLDFRII